MNEHKYYFKLITTIETNCSWFICASDSIHPIDWWQAFFIGCFFFSLPILHSVETRVEYHSKEHPNCVRLLRISENEYFIQIAFVVRKLTFLEQQNQNAKSYRIVLYSISMSLTCKSCKHLNDITLIPCQRAKETIWNGVYQQYILIVTEKKQNNGTNFLRLHCPLNPYRFCSFYFNDVSLKYWCNALRRTTLSQSNKYKRLQSQDKNTPLNMPTYPPSSYSVYIAHIHRHHQVKDVTCNIDSQYFTHQCLVYR